MTKPSARTIRYSYGALGTALIIAALALATGPVWLWAFVALVLASVGYLWADDIRARK